MILLFRSEKLVAERETERLPVGTVLTGRKMRWPERMRFGNLIEKWSLDVPRHLSNSSLFSFHSRTPQTQIVELFLFPPTTLLPFQLASYYHTPPQLLLTIFPLPLYIGIKWDHKIIYLYWCHLTQKYIFINIKNNTVTFFFALTVLPVLKKWK